ncbi:MAG: hypothetical protein DRP64_05550, partial [Verrucomicrobia bacterium]
MKKSICIGMVVAVVSAACGNGNFGKNETAFVFPDRPAAAQWYNGYVRSFYTNRIDIGAPLFPKEYLALSDSWMNDAFWDETSIQAFTRDDLLDAQMDDEGYLFAQQHGASSHDHGWPFPHWIQVPGKNGSDGVTAGWHFYDNPSDWEIVYTPAREARPQYFSVAATETW